MRDKLFDWFMAGVRAADPGPALARALAEEPPVAVGRVFVIAIGKAAVPMMRAAIEAVPEPAKAILVTNPENAADLPGVETHLAAHPVPDQVGIDAALAVERVVGQATRGDLVLALISGGGSAMLPAPAAGLTLDDKIAVGRLMLASGMEITEMNLVRQQLSRLKGGGLRALCGAAEVRTYAMSDVIGDDPRAIASGPTVGPLGSRADAAALLTKYGLWDEVPRAVRVHLLTPDTQMRPDPGHFRLIGSNRISLEAVRDAAGKGAVIVDDHLTGPVEAACDRIIAAAQAAGGPATLIFGGETVVRLTGDGLGGRNQELALRVALAARGLPFAWTFLSAGTDGRDGPTDAAGAAVGNVSLRRMKAAGIDAEASLARNDSYHALQASDDLLITGGTGTNVADIQIFRRRKERRAKT